MKNKFRIVLSLFLVLACLAPSLPLGFAASGVSYYIDSRRGNDASAGTSEAAAWKSIENIKNLPLGAGDKILFKRGESFNCTNLTLTCSGTAENPVVISCYGDATADKPLLTTQERAEVLRLIDCSHITLSELEITAHNGGGIWIDTLAATSTGISLVNLDMHDIQNYKVNSRDNLSAGAASARACVMVKGLPARSRYAVNDLKIIGCEMFDCGNGISMWGSWNDSQTPWCETEEEIDPVYNTGFLVENCFFHNMDAEAIIIGMCDGALVTNCRALDCCLGEGVDENGKVLYYTAAIWFWGSENSTVEYCEIAGQKNVGDGMAVDFDSHTNNCTYQYIYSHDNTRFMCNCPNYSGQHGNTVRYCLSINDNRGRSRIGGTEGEHEFSFYNNTIINCGEFQLMNAYNALIANNIIVPADGCVVAYDLSEVKNGNIFSNNCYYNCLTPIIDSSSLNTIPGFSGTNFDVAANARLAAGSPLVGGGMAIDSGLTKDFFGNEIASCNIGCYGGDGTEVEYNAETLLAKFLRMVRLVFDSLSHELSTVFVNITDWFDSLLKK